MAAQRFTGRQITVMVVAACIAVIAFPAGVYAASLTGVKIVDPGNGSVTRVDAGKLRVGDGGGSLTVDGRVDTYPKTIFSTHSVLPAGTSAFLKSVPAGTQLRITSVLVTNTGSGMLNLALNGRTDSTNCTGGPSSTYLRFEVAQGSAQQYTFPTPLLINDRCATWVPDAGSADVIATGFTVT